MQLEKVDILSMLKIMKANYAYAFRDLDKEQTNLMANTWYAILSKEPKELVQMAFYKSLEVCKMPPTIADIKEQIENILNAAGESSNDIWERLDIALKKANSEIPRFVYTAIDSETGKSQGFLAKEVTRKLYDELGECEKEYVGSYEAFISLGKDWYLTDKAIEKAKFLKALPDIKKRFRLREEMSPALKEILQGAQDILQIEDKGEE